MKINKLYFNWHECGEQWGEDYNVAEIGENGCIKIEEYIPTNGLEKHYFDIYFEDETRQRVFNPNHVFYLGESK